MKTYIVLLRGVMPTGKNRVPMAQLRELLSDNGFEAVRTWIQSGNVVLRTALSPAELEESVRQLIKTHIGPELAIIARTGEQLQQLLDENPFREGYDISRVFYVSFQEYPSSEKVESLLAQDFAPEVLAITSTAAYMYIPHTYGRGKLSNNFLERKLGVAATTRNFNTLKKLIELSGQG
ncbi:MAG: DUF1697 domain-containing protein [Phaeodactylibacter sp.]|nr:DUF1697 domain-containing protein [Phaeodactylibacter sp.]MCB9274879.1 DUF1697 domain-containing protein [Lewinellaceae bacterium]